MLPKINIQFGECTIIIMEVHCESVVFRIFSISLLFQVKSVIPFSFPWNHDISEFQRWDRAARLLRHVFMVPEGLGNWV
jgi:hypothetical protein